MVELPSARHPALKPCPFCGGRDISFVVRNPSYGECADCLTEGPSADSPTKAMAAWDRRAGDEYPSSSVVQGRRTMADRQVLLALAIRCETEVPSDMLNWAIHEGAIDTPGFVRPAGPYTSSIDAAVTLVPEGVWNVNVTWSTAFGHWIASVCGPGRLISQSKAKTEALARCAAALRSRAGEEA